MDCRLQVFKGEPNGSSQAKTYRFAVLDYSRAKDYPANFVCMLPVKVDQRNAKTSNAFGERFGDKSLEIAVGLLNAALKSESDVEVKTEIERRIRLLDPKQAGLVKCSACKKTCQAKSVKRYRKTLCEDCLKTRYTRRY